MPGQRLSEAEGVSARLKPQYGWGGLTVLLHTATLAQLPPPLLTSTQAWGTVFLALDAVQAQVDAVISHAAASKGVIAAVPEVGRTVEGERGPEVLETGLRALDRGYGSGGNTPNVSSQYRSSARSTR